MWREMSSFWIVFSVKQKWGHHLRGLDVKRVNRTKSCRESSKEETRNKTRNKQAALKDQLSWKIWILTQNKIIYFNHHHLTAWIKNKEKEKTWLNKWTSQLQINQSNRTQFTEQSLSCQALKCWKCSYSCKKDKSSTDKIITATPWKTPTWSQTNQSSSLLCTRRSWALLKSSHRTTRTAGASSGGGGYKHAPRLHNQAYFYHLYFLSFT